MAAAVKITMVMLRMTPISAGTICTAVRRSGLYSVRISNGLARGATAPWRCGSGTAASPRATVSIIGSLPSTSSCTAARSVCSLRRSKSAGMYTPTLISPAFRRRRSSSTLADGARKRTTPVAPSSATSAREWLVSASSTTAARMPRTSKLIA